MIYLEIVQSQSTDSVYMDLDMLIPVQPWLLMNQTQCVA